MCNKLTTTVNNDADALEDYFIKFENNPPPHAEVQAINELLNPNTPAIVLDSITWGCHAKLDQERSKYIKFHVYVWWMVQELKLSMWRRARAVDSIIDLYAKYIFNDY